MRHVAKTTCCIIVCVVFLSANITSKCQPKIFFRPYEYTITNPNNDYMYISTLQVGVGQCASACVRESKCLSVLYNNKLHTCVLLRCLLNPNTVKPDSAVNGWTYFIKDPDKKCADGWHAFEDHCYYYNLTAVPWEQAKSACYQSGAYLVEIGSNDENQWLVKELMNDLRTRWIGATDQEKENQYIWDYSKTELIFDKWRVGEPNNSKDKEHCAVIMKNGQWNDVRCNSNMCFVCEKNH